MNIEQLYKVANMVRNGETTIPAIAKDVAMEYGVDFKNDLILYDPPCESMQQGHLLTILTTDLSFYKIEILDNEVIFTDQTNEFIITNSGKGKKESDGMIYLRTLLRLNKASQQTKSPEPLTRSGDF